MNASIVIDPFNRLDAVPLVSSLERKSIDKLYKACNRFAATKVGDINSFYNARDRRKLEDAFEAGKAFFGLTRKTSG